MAALSLYHHIGHIIKKLYKKTFNLNNKMAISLPRVTKFVFSTNLWNILKNLFFCFEAKKSEKLGVISFQSTNTLFL